MCVKYCVDSALEKGGFLSSANFDKEGDKEKKGKDVECFDLMWQCFLWVLLISQMMMEACAL